MATLFGRVSLIGKLRYYFLDRNYNQTVRVGLIGLCLLLTIVSTLMLRDINRPVDILKGFIPPILLAGLIAFILIYSEMQLVVGVLLAVTMLLDDGIGTGTGTKITFTFILLHVWAAVWLFKMLLVDRKLSIRSSTANLPAIMFMVIVVLSFFWSWGFVDHNVSFVFNTKLLPRLMTALVLIISPMTYFLCANHIRSVGTLRFIVWWFIIIGLIFAVMLLLFKTLPRPLNAKGQFPTWVGAFAAGQLFFNTKLKWYIRVALVFVIGVWIYIMLGLGLSWLSGWVPLVIVFGVALFFYSRKLLLLTSIAVVIIMGVNTSFVHKAFNSEEQESGDTRSVAWSAALALTEKHLFLGTGPAGYAFYYATNGFPANFSHNNYVDIIAQTGVVGFTAYIAFWLSLGYMVWKMYRTVQGDGFVRGLKYSLIGTYIATLVVMMLGDWVTPFTYTQGLDGIDYAIWAWIAAGMTVALYHIGQHSPDALMGAEPANEKRILET